MNDKLLLESEQFALSLDFQVFESDIEYPLNTILSVCVSSSGFSATTTMDIDIKAACNFCNELENVYNTLKGSTNKKLTENNTFSFREMVMDTLWFPVS